MEIGPVDVLEVAFPGNEFNGAILPALENLIASGTIRVLDLLFVYKTADGEVGSIELAGHRRRSTGRCSPASTVTCRADCWTPRTSPS